MTESNNFMNTAIKEANKSLKCRGVGPFGAVIVKNNKIIAHAHNTVVKTNDPTAHAEINAIRKACKKLKTFDLSDCQLYTSTYPCPMCLSACYWAKISQIFYANTSKDAAKIGFIDDELYDFFKKNKFAKIKIKQEKNKDAIKTFENYQGLIY